MAFFKRITTFIKSHKGPRRIFGSGIVLLLAMAASIVVGYRALEVTLRERSINNEVRLLREQIAKLREENARIQESIGRAHSKEEVEKTAKAELNLQKPGEKVAVVVFSATLTPSAEPKPKTFWERLSSIILFWRK